MFKKTKIVATVGPSSESKEVLVKLVKTGVDVFRLNFAHGNIKYFEEIVKGIREIEEEFNKYIPIIGDLEGPTVRIGKIEKDLLAENQIVKIINADKAKERGLKYVYVGNINNPRYETTYCPKCGKPLIVRYGYEVLEYKLERDNKCPYCGEKILIRGRFVNKGLRWKFIY